MLSMSSRRNIGWSALTALEMASESQGGTSLQGCERIEGGRRKYYNTTEEGKNGLVSKLNEWDALNNLVKSCREGLLCMNLMPISTL